MLDNEVRDRRHQEAVLDQDCDEELMAKKLEWMGPGREEPLLVTPVLHLREEPLLVTPGACHLAPVRTQFRREQIPRTTYQPCLREDYLEMYGDLIVNNVCDGPGRTPP